MNGIIWTAGAGRELQEVYEQLEDICENSGANLIEEVQRMLHFAFITASYGQLL